MRYTVHLTEEEIKTMLSICNQIGGSPSSSPRKYADSVSEKLSNLINFDSDAVKDYYSGSITCSNFEEVIVTVRKPF